MIDPKHPLWDVERSLIALHESCHVVAAMEMGLPVDWVDINTVTVEGTQFIGATFISKRVEFPDDAEATAVSLAAPAGWPTGNETLDYYAGIELTAALEIAGHNGIDSILILDKVASIISTHTDDIYELKNRLDREGRVTFTTV